MDSDYARSVKQITRERAFLSLWSLSRTIDGQSGSGDRLMKEHPEYAQGVTAPGETSDPFVAAEKVGSIVADARPIVPQTASWRDRKWTRSVEDLSRSERWRRRLPDVCR
jgi:hypothetical protein